MLWIVGGIRLRSEYAPNFYRVHKAQYNKVLDGLTFQFSLIEMKSKYTHNSKKKEEESGAKFLSVIVLWVCGDKNGVLPMSL